MTAEETVRPSGAEARANLQRGMLLMIVGMLILPFVLRAGGLNVGRNIWIHAARGFLIALATLLFFTSLKDLALADAISIFFVEPFILTLLSIVFLGERVGWRRALAVAVGFCGALVIIRPSYAVFGAAALLPMAAAFSFACYVILTRLLVQRGSAVTMQFYAGLFGGLVMSLALWYGHESNIAFLAPAWPSSSEWLLLALLGTIATTGHMLIVHAIRRVGASMVAPFQYLEIISATILGFVVFGDFPDTVTWLGIAIIIGSGLYVFFRERHLAENGPA